MPIDKNARLCSKDVQHHIVSALDLIDSDSLRYIVSDNLIESARLDKAIKHLRQVVTNRRTCQLISSSI